MNDILKQIRAMIEIRKAFEDWRKTLLELILKFGKLEVGDVSQFTDFYGG